MTGEQSRLLEHAENGYGTSTSAITSDNNDSPDDLEEDLGGPAGDVVAWARRSTAGASPGTEDLPLISDHEGNLAILLYAIYLNRTRSGSLLAKGTQSRSRDRVLWAQKVQKADEVLLRLVEHNLDGGISSVAEDDQEEAHSARGDSGVKGEGVEEALWHKWLIDGRRCSVIDLLLPPHTRSPSILLSHPLLVHAMDHTWQSGPPAAISHDASHKVPSRILRTMESYITPKRAHTLNLLSYIFLLFLTVYLAISPHKWIHPVKKQSRHPGGIEALYITWVYSTFFNAFPNLTRTVFLIPSALVPLLAYLDSETAFAILALSIFPLTFLLVLPMTPSLVFLHQDIVPLSTLLVHILRRGLRSAGLILPLALLVFGVFAWSLNGDIFRGFDTIQIAIPVVSQDLPPGSIEELETFEPPSEPGIAPFETRVWLFTTFVALFLSSISLTLVRILTPPHVHSNHHVQDTWEADYGPTISLAARQNWIMAIRTEIDRKEIVPPLNWTVDSVLPLDEILFVLSYIPDGRKGVRLKRWESKMQWLRDRIWVCVMGPLCFPLYLWDRIVESTL